jgi:hypothetical protein
MVNVLPRPGVLSAKIEPPAFSIKLRATVSPSPRPWPISRVRTAERYPAPAVRCARRRPTNSKSGTAASWVTTENATRASSDRS